MPKSTGTKKRRKNNVDHSGPQAWSQKGPMRKASKREDEDEAAATAKERRIDELYAICRKSIWRLCKGWPTKFKADDFPELERHEFFFHSPDQYPMDSLDGQIEYWECRIQELEEIEFKLLDEFNPFTKPNITG